MCIKIDIVKYCYIIAFILKKNYVISIASHCAERCIFLTIAAVLKNKQVATTDFAILVMTQTVRIYKILLVFNVQFVFINIF